MQRQFSMRHQILSFSVNLKLDLPYMSALILPSKTKASQSDAMQEVKVLSMTLIMIYFFWSSREWSVE